MARIVKDSVNAVVEQIERDKDYLVDLTRRLVRIPTVNPKFESNPEINREPELQSRLQSELDSLGMATEMTEVFPGRPNLTGTLAGSEERSLILNGHVDVVPVGERSQWTVDPFGADIREGRLYGRGSLDMKGGVAVNVAVLIALGVTKLTGWTRADPAFALAIS